MNILICYSIREQAWIVSKCVGIGEHSRSGNIIVSYGYQYDTMMVGMLPRGGRATYDSNSRLYWVPALNVLPSYSTPRKEVSFPHRAFESASVNKIYLSIETIGGPTKYKMFLLKGTPSPFEFASKELMNNIQEVKAYAVRHGEAPIEVIAENLAKYLIHIYTHTHTVSDPRSGIPRQYSTHSMMQCYPEVPPKAAKKKKKDPENVILEHLTDKYDALDLNCEP